MEPQCLYWGSAFQGFLPPFKDTFDNSKPMQVLSVPTVKWYIPEQDYRYTTAAFPPVPRTPAHRPWR